MSVFSQNFLLCVRSPLLYAKRFRAKINIQRPRQPHYERARVLALTAPIYPKPDVRINCFEKTTNNVKENPYNDIIAREVLNWLNHSNMIAIFHLNSIQADELFKVKVALYKQNMHLKYYGKKIIGKAVKDTKFEAINQLFDSNHCIVFSSEEKVSQLIKMTRRVPQMILLGGIVENKLMDRNEFVEFAKLPDLQSMRSQLVGVLNMAANQIVCNLESHQKDLMNVFDVYAKSDSKESDQNITELEPESEKL